MRVSDPYIGEDWEYRGVKFTWSNEKECWETPEGHLLLVDVNGTWVMHGSIGMTAAACVDIAAEAHPGISAELGHGTSARACLEGLLEASKAVPDQNVGELLQNALDYYNESLDLKCNEGLLEVVSKYAATCCAYGKPRTYRMHLYVKLEMVVGSQEDLEPRVKEAFFSDQQRVDYDSSIILLVTSTEHKLTKEDAEQEVKSLVIRGYPWVIPFLPSKHRDICERERLEHEICKFFNGKINISGHRPLEALQEALEHIRKAKTLAGLS